jgi:hypothetical protein
VSLCLAAGGATAVLPLTAFLLSWTHSVERIEWRELWRVEAGALVLVEARVKGSGAGMEPGEGAVLRDGWWVWRPETRVPELALARSGSVAPWRLCAPSGASCRDLSARLGGDGPIRLSLCGSSGQAHRGPPPRNHFHTAAHRGAGAGG